MTNRRRCHDCGCCEGDLHRLGCDFERCPFCGGQLISCNCRYNQKLSGYRDFRIDSKHPTKGLPRSVYERGLPDNQEKMFEQTLVEKGRIPYVHWPILCAYCGKFWPEFFRVPDAEWERYIELGMRDKIVCWTCWNRIKRLIDKAAIRRRHAGEDK